MTKSAQLAVRIQGRTVTVQTEAGPLEMPLHDWIEELRPPVFDAGGIRWPDGVVGHRPLRDGGVVLVHETPPMVRRLRWVADDSPEPFGPGAVYRDVSLALPYVVTLVVFMRKGKQLQLTSHNEAFFRTSPLSSFDDHLLCPALLNCSRMVDDGSNPVSWICVQKLSPRTWNTSRGDAKRLRAGTGALLQHLYETGFNKSSDVHELSSWYTETIEAGVDPRVRSLDNWEAASRDDSLFVLDVPWLTSGHTVQTVLERMEKRLGLHEDKPTTAEDLARLVINRPRPGRRRAVSSKSLFEGLLG